MYTQMYTQAQYEAERARFAKATPAILCQVKNAYRFSQTLSAQQEARMRAVSDLMEENRAQYQRDYSKRRYQERKYQASKRQESRS